MASEIRLTPRQEIWRGTLFGQRSLLVRLMAEVKAEYALTTPQFEALLTLWESPDRALSMSDLSHSLLYSSGSASNLVRQLDARGLTSREPSPDDRRGVTVRLTAAGCRLIEQARAHHLAQLAEAFDPLIADDEVEVLLRVARRLAAREGVTAHP